MPASNRDGWQPRPGSPELSKKPLPWWLKSLLWLAFWAYIYFIFTAHGVNQWPR